MSTPARCLRARFSSRHRVISALVILALIGGRVSSRSHRPTTRRGSGATGCALRPRLAGAGRHGARDTRKKNGTDSGATARGTRGKKKGTDSPAPAAQRPAPPQKGRNKGQKGAKSMGRAPGGFEPVPGP
jgi:hypothetical protein